MEQELKQPEVVVELSRDEQVKKDAMFLARQCVIAFHKIYPKYLVAIDSITGTDAKKILRYGFRMPFKKEPVSFNRPELDKLYEMSLQIRELQDNMVLVGGLLGDSDPATASETVEKAVEGFVETTDQEETKESIYG